MNTFCYTIIYYLKTVLTLTKKAIDHEEARVLNYRKLLPIHCTALVPVAHSKLAHSLLLAQQCCFKIGSI